MRTEKCSDQIAIANAGERECGCNLENLGAEWRRTEESAAMKKAWSTRGCGIYRLSKSNAGTVRGVRRWTKGDDCNNELQFCRTQRSARMLRFALWMVSHYFAHNEQEASVGSCDDLREYPNEWFCVDSRRFSATRFPCDRYMILENSLLSAETLLYNLFYNVLCDYMYIV